MQPSEHFALGSGVVRQIAGARYGVISITAKPITVVTFGSVDAIGADEGSLGPLLADTVAKVENRTTPKISRKLILRRLYR